MAFSMTFISDVMFTSDRLADESGNGEDDIAKKWLVCSLQRTPSVPVAIPSESDNNTDKQTDRKTDRV